MPLTDEQSLRVHEATANVALARLLRDECGMNAQAEMVINGRRPDILIQRGDGPVVIESEFAPARSVDDDALARLFLKVGGRSVGVTFALALPRELRHAHESELESRLCEAVFAWRTWFSTVDSGPDETGSLHDLANAVNAASARVADIEDAVTCLETGTYAAGATLYPSAGSMAHVAKVFDRDESQEVANMAALMCINALVLHDRLRAANPGIPPPPAHSEETNLVGGEFIRNLLASWKQVMDIDYKPIFEKPYDVLSGLPAIDAINFVTECRNAALDLAQYVTASGHDLSGQVFNRLVADRKFLAAYYTSIPAATLLAGLALDPARWPEVDWGDIDSIRDFAVLDPACGTGTLLMAAYQQVVRNHRRANTASTSASEEELHKALIEHSIHGSDVVDAAIHITASTLAAMAPRATFDSMNVHVFPLGFDSKEGGTAKVGSLEWLDTQSVWSMFSGAAEQVSANGSRTKAQVPRPDADLVIANPPFRRHSSATGAGDYRTRVFGQFEEEAAELSARLSEVLKGTPANLVAGLASAFVLLADRTIASRGRIAFVLPASALSGMSWRGIRELIATAYQVEWVVSLHDPRDQSLSYDTGIAEVLLVARKIGEDETASGRARFVNLWRRPDYAGEAEAVLRQLRKIPEKQLALDGPPVGGSELTLGTEKWGEIIDAPIDGGPWIGSRWRSGAVAQSAFALAKGNLWSVDATEVVAQLPVDELERVVHISPYDLQIRGTQGPFDVIRGWDRSVKFPALWHVNSDSQRSMVNVPDARLVPKVAGRSTDVWKNAGTLHVSRDVGYSSQRIIATTTDYRVLGVRSWFTLTVRDIADADLHDATESVLSLWLNSTLGMLFHANHANRSQPGRGIGNRTMLRTMPVLDVRQLTVEQLARGQQVFSDLRTREFETFHQCAIDPARIELDERLIMEVLVLDDDSVATVSDLREMLAQEPSIFGGKKPMLPPPDPRRETL